MTIIRIDFNHECLDREKCSDKMMAEIVKLTGANLIAKTITEKLDGHISTAIGLDGKHQIWLILYDRQEVHEGSETLPDGKAILRLTYNPRVREWKGVKPKAVDIQNELIKLHDSSN